MTGFANPKSQSFSGGTAQDRSMVYGKITCPKMPICTCGMEPFRRSRHGYRNRHFGIIAEMDRSGWGKQLDRMSISLTFIQRKYCPIWVLDHAQPHLVAQRPKRRDWTGAELSENRRLLARNCDLL